MPLITPQPIIPTFTFSAMASPRSLARRRHLSCTTRQGGRSAAGPLGRIRRATVRRQRVVAPRTAQDGEGASVVQIVHFDDYQLGVIAGDRVVDVTRLVGDPGLSPQDR